MLDELDLAVDRVNAADVVALTGVEVEAALLDLARVEAKLAAAKSRLCRRYDLSKDWALTGAQHPGAVIATELRVPTKSCRRPFTLARTLEQLPALHQALAKATVTVQHRDRILAVDNPRVHDAFVADHGTFVGWAETLDWVGFDTALVLWLHRHDPDGPDPGEERRGLNFSQTWANEFVLDGRMGAVKGTIVGNELTRLYDLLFKADWKAAKEHLGRDPHDHELGRTPSQRRLDALVLAFQRSATGPEEGRKGAILACILLGSDAARWLCEFTTGTRLRPGQVAPHVDDVVFETFLYGSGRRDVSVSKQRLFVEALRRAAQAKGRQCFHPYCDRPASECQIDHKIPHTNGGPTSIANSQPACAFHNGAKGSKDPDSDDDP